MLFGDKYVVAINEKYIKHGRPFTTAGHQHPGRTHAFQYLGVHHQEAAYKLALEKANPVECNSNSPQESIYFYSEDGDRGGQYLFKLVGYRHNILENRILYVKMGKGDDDFVPYDPSIRCLGKKPLYMKASDNQQYSLNMLTPKKTFGKVQQRIGAFNNLEVIRVK